MSMEYRAGKKIELTCTRCGIKFMRPAITIRPEQKDFYCSRACLKKPYEEKLKARREARKIWDDANREHVRSRAREYKIKNPEQIKESKRKDWEKHKEKYRARSKIYNEKNKEWLDEKRRKYYAKNREAMLLKTKKYRQDHPEWMKAFRKKHWENNRHSVLWSSTKKSAKVKGVIFDLTQEWMKKRIDAGVCEMSGLPFDMKGKRSANSPSTDRINPNGGYTQDNCRMILWSINRALCNYGEDYILSVFDAILKRKAKK